MKNCLLTIREYMSSLSKQEKKIANFLLNNKNVAAGMTISELSLASECSTTTILRFCVDLGYEGYRDFSKSYYHDVALGEEGDDSEKIYDIDQELPSEMPIESVIETVSRVNIEAITNTLKMLEVEDIEKAVNIIDKASRVCFYALSGSALVAEDGVFKFQRLGINSQSYLDSHSQILSTEVMTKDDVAIIISYSGETKELIDTINFLKNSHCTIIAITMFGTNSISKLADLNIQHSSVGKGLKTYSTRSRVVQHNIIDILYVALCVRRKEQFQRYYSLFKTNYDNTKVNS